VRGWHCRNLLLSVLGLQGELWGATSHPDPVNRPESSRLATSTVISSNSEAAAAERRLQGVMADAFPATAVTRRPSVVGLEELNCNVRMWRLVGRFFTTKLGRFSGYVVRLAYPLAPLLSLSRRVILGCVCDPGPNQPGWPDQPRSGMTWPRRCKAPCLRA
jgi:hypothetical protein